jgi:chromosome segregation protein
MPVTPGWRRLPANGRNGATAPAAPAVRLEELAQRDAVLAATRARLSGEPARLAAARETILSELEVAERARGRASDRVVAGEAAQAATERALRQAEATLSDMREARVRAEAAVAAVIEEMEQLKQRAVERLNREARERLLTSFEVVNGHFKRLFVELFGGGEAALHLIESDDPLEAGLEIIAKPPGKKPQTLSLLSGGEQALTALALIFAVFLTNPSPICVLDEVDAPLDDHNVERFCNLLHEMTPPPKRASSSSRTTRSRWRG